ncbi:MAG: peptidylprolyl isomerase [Syntrophobacteraceae bacterium]|jgi:FKBP-type peptidyl-prolyl cis-trans isomerase SlyD|nr:peptidylprolyl isomerase [Syntrophobacteraceae bacterium]
MRIGPNTFVILEYTVRLPDGSFVKGENGPVSLNFIVGYNQVLPALEQRLLGMSAGETRDFTIPASQAFGPRDPGQVHRRHFSEFPEGRKLEAGKWMLARNEQTQAQYSYHVLDKTDEWVDLDFNHPLAGKDLLYHVTVAHVRPASQDELEYLRPCEVGSEDGFPDRE